MTIYFSSIDNFFHQMTINERIELLISTLKQNNNSFGKSIGVNATIIHNIVKGRNAPSYEILHKIALSFVDINMNWLISESGEMFKADSELKIDQGNEPGTKHKQSQKHCEKCKMNEELINSLMRENETLRKVITLLESK